MRNKLCVKNVASWGGRATGLGMALLLVLGLAGRVPAETYSVNMLNAITVNNFDLGEESDSVPGDGIAEGALGTGRTSLRAAIEESNQLPGHDIITVPGGLTLQTRMLLPALTDPDGVTIMTRGEGNFILDGSVAAERLTALVGVLNSNFDTFDLNNNDLLSRNEANNFTFEQIGGIIHNLGGLRGVDFDYVDTNNDNSLSKTELEEYIPNETGLIIASPNNVIMNLTIINYPVDGVQLNTQESDGNIIQGCLIGTDGAGDTGNKKHGIILTNGAENNIIGGTTEEARNIISGNGTPDTTTDEFDNVITTNYGNGIYLNGADVTGNRIIGNYIGTDKEGKVAVPNAFSGVVVRNGASGNEIGGSAEGEGNIISGNGDASDGCPDNCGNGLYNHYGNGVYVLGATTGDNLIQGNLVGLTSDGASLRNKSAGIRLDGTPLNYVGGAEEGAGNRVTGHGSNQFLSSGIALIGVDGVRVENNVASGNSNGLAVSESTNCIIGTPGAGNVFSGNTSGVGINDGSNHIFQSNYVGTNESGTGGAANGHSGLYIGGDLSNILLGGSGDGEGNVFSGNANDGIVIYEINPLDGPTTPVIFIEGNMIGTNATGTAALANGVVGILLDDGARNVQIGGTAEGEGNVISGNGLDGIRIARSPDGLGAANEITILGNKIGTNLAGTSFIGNSGSGVSIFEGANEIEVGGVNPGEANVIAGNGDFGVRIKGGSLEITNQNSIRGNSIYSNGEAGIRLEDDSNDDMPAPVIDLIGPVRGTTAANAVVDLYADSGTQGRFYLASATADGSGNFSINADLSGLTVNKLTATATNPGGSTSEFSVPFEIAPPSIDTHPSSVIVVEGEPFSLSTEASGSEPLAYQWQFLPVDGAEFEDVTDGGAVSGATTNTLSNSAAALTVEGSYQCVVSNAVDTVTTIVVSVDVIPANTDTAVVSSLTDVSDANTASPAHLIVDPGEDGVISLREAIIAANNRAGADTITFNLAGTIALQGGLPALTDIDGGTTIDGAGDIVVNGANLGGSIVGFQLSSANNVLTGLTIINFPGNGVSISGAGATGNAVTGCLIGTNGTAPQANGGHGVAIEDLAADTTIGGVDADARNIISGNEGSGVYVAGVSNTLITGNYIGLSANGQAAVANGEAGVTLIEGATGTAVGGEADGEGNVISANNDSGVLISGVGTTGNRVAGNTIGLSANGASQLGNVAQGVALFDGASGNIIGGSAIEAGNLISGNAGAAVLVDGPATIQNTIRFNEITGNFGTGIELSNDGNLLLAAPVITGLGSVIGTAVPGATVDIFASSDEQGETYLATVVADGNGDFTSPIDVEPVVGQFITATATDASGNTSEFSAGFFVDLEPPVLTLLGATPVTVQCGAAYVDAGATAVDDVDGDITHRIARTITFGGDVVASVNTGVLGTYTITYEVSDNAGQAATPVTRTVDVVDTTAPVITLNGAAALLLECGATYTEAGASATDGCDGDLEVTILGAVDPSTPGVYPILYRVSDAQGNAATDVTRTVTVADTTRPVISVLGALSVTLECGTPYLDAGATVSDTCDSAVEVETDNPVEPGVPGVYTVLYDSTDASGNEAGQAFRTVTVVDTTAPEITLLGGGDITVECGVPYNEPGAVVSDTCENDLDFIVTGTVNTSAPGNYTLVYSASDSAGNVAETVTRIVRVADNARPVITLNGASTVNVECGGTYTEAGATASDNCEGDLSDAIVISGSVNTSVAGTYTINYDVADSIGNLATRVSRTVIVAVCPAPCEDQCAGDPDNAIDEDGDGLTACIETCLGTDDAVIDSDGDGVPDGTEVDNGTDPIVPDSDLDVDGDGLTQLEEFIFDSDALDPNSPAISFFVSAGGADVAGGGSSTSPWASISYAIAQSGASSVNPVRIIIADGNYPEDVELIPWVTLVGAVGSTPRIEGTVFGADNSGLVNIEIAAFTSDEVMLVMDNVAMSLVDVVFRGSVARPAAGILADGARSGLSTIDGCYFTSVSIGIDVGGALPVIRRCTFEDTTIAGVFVRDTASIGAGASMGDVDDPSTGSNLFSGITQGRAIINELDTTLLAQQNDWGTLDVNRIQRDLVSGPVTVAPVLVPGSAADTASLFVTVWTAETQNRIRNAAVTASTSGGASVTVEANRNGVYSLPILRSGTYTIDVDADGYEGQTLSVTLEAGELGSQIVALQLPGGKTGGPSCYGAPGSTLGFGLSDILVAALLLGALLAGSRFWRVDAQG